MSKTSTSLPPLRGALRAKGVAAFLDCGESTVWRWVKEGRIPPGIKLTPRTTVWPLEVVQALLTAPAVDE